MIIMTHSTNDDNESEIYKSVCGMRMQRESQSPWKWILYDSQNNIIDKDQYRHYLAERHGITLIPA